MISAIQTHLLHHFRLAADFTGLRKREHQRDVFLDNEWNDRAAIARLFAHLESVARRRGSAIVQHRRGPEAQFVDSSR